MSLAPPEAAGPLRRERLRTARLYFVCDARPAARTPRRCCARRWAAASTSSSCARRSWAGREIERAARPSAASADTTAPSSSSTTIPSWRAPATPTGSTSARTTARAEEAREVLGPDAIIGLSTHSEEQIAAAAERPVDYISVGPDLGDADQGGPAGGRPRAGRARRRGRAAPVLRDRRHRPLQRRGGRSGRGAAAGRRARDPRRGDPAGGRRSAARRARRRRRGRARWLSEPRKRKQRTAAPRGRDEARLRAGRGAQREAREALEPLAEGERPTGRHDRGGRSPALIAALDRCRLPGRGRGQRRKAALRPGAAPALLMGVMAWGMWRARYWAVLGFQLILVFLIFSAVFGLARAGGERRPVRSPRRRCSPSPGRFFYFMVKAMARIQMPEPRSAPELRRPCGANRRLPGRDRRRALL